MTLCTETEAAKKWCPMARAPGTMIDSDESRTFVTQNRGYQMGGALPNCMCIGSRCMAWRFGHEMTTEQIAILGSADTLTRVGTKLSEKGYCGAFGKVDP